MVGKKGRNLKFKYEDVKNFIESVGCKLLSESYYGVKDPLLVEDALGHKYTISFSEFRSKKQYQCRECGLKRTADSRRLNFETIKSYIESRGCKLLSPIYKTQTEQLEILFICGHIDHRSYADFKKGKSNLCYKCAGSKPYTLEEIKDKFAEFGFELHEESYVNALTKMSFSDENGYWYYYSYHVIDNATKHGNGEVERFAKPNKYTLENIFHWININGKPYILECDEYKGNHVSNLNLTCTICGHKWTTCWASIYSNGTGCSICAIKTNAEKSRGRTVTNEWNVAAMFPYLVEEWDFEKNTLSPKDVSPQSNLMAHWICSQCGHKWAAIISSRAKPNGNGCRACGMSGGAKRIYSFLKENNVPNAIEYFFIDLLSDLGNPLRYDFGILKNEENINDLIALIEFDGDQHDRFIPFFHRTEEDFVLRQKYDLLKDEYARKRNIPMIRIKQKDFDNIPQILSEFLSLN